MTGITISVTCHIYSNKNDRILILVSILPYSRLQEEIENDETIYVELARDLKSDCDVTIPVTCRISSNTDATD